MQVKVTFLEVQYPAMFPDLKKLKIGNQPEKESGELQGFKHIAKDF